MKGFAKGGRYSFETDQGLFEAEYLDCNRASNENVFYFKNFEENYRVTLLYYVPKESWRLMASMLDGSHESMTRDLLVPVGSVSPEFRPVMWDEGFEATPVEGLLSITSHYSE